MKYNVTIGLESNAGWNKKVQGKKLVRWSDKMGNIKVVVSKFITLYRRRLLDYAFFIQMLIWTVLPEFPSKI